MRFITFYAEFRKHGPKDGSAGRLLSLLHRSIRLHHPKADCVLLSDRRSALPDLERGFSVERFDVDPEKTMLARMQAEIAYLKKSGLEEPAVLLDWDILLNRPLDALFKRDFDVALTYRQNEDLPYRRRHLAINGGVTFLKGRASLDFLERVHRTFTRKYDEPKMWWWGQQQALIDEVGAANVPESGERAVEAAGTNVLLLPCETHNFSPPASAGAYLSFWPDKYALHFKGKRKKWMEKFWDLHHGTRESPGIAAVARQAAAAISIGAGSVVERAAALVRRPPSIPKKNAAKGFPPIPDANHEKLRQLLQNQTVLIVGSGPSAAGLTGPIPRDWKLLTCNAGPKLLLEKGLRERIDLYFMIRSKKGRTIEPEGASVGKTEYLESTARRSKIDLFVTNDVDALAQDLRGAARDVLFDNAKDDSYLSPLILPSTVEEIRGSSPLPWTSTGLRLLQYALYYGAREIYLIGVDFGRGGYFWGPNANEWRHGGIDENFLKFIGKKYSNVYSLSSSSPACEFLPQKDPAKICAGSLKEVP